jgi:hypothetical protein
MHSACKDSFPSLSTSKANLLGVSTTGSTCGVLVVPKVVVHAGVHLVLLTGACEYYFPSSLLVTNEDSNRFFRNWGTALPKCFACVVGRSAFSNQEGGIPIGLDQPELLPCGCDVNWATLELHLVGNHVWNKRTQVTAANNPPMMAVSPSLRY